MTDPTDTAVRDALLAYTGDEPPAGFSYDRIRTAGRRARRLRRICVAGSAAAAAAVAVGVAVLAFPRPTPIPAYVVAGPAWPTLDPTPFCRAATAPPTGPTVAPTTVVSEKNDYRIRIPSEPADHAAARISCYLARAVPARLPGAVFHRDPATPAGTVPLQAYPYRVFDPARPAETVPPGISASAVVSNDAGVGDIGFGVGPASESTAAAARDCTAPSCTVRIGPHGETVTVLDVHADGGQRLVNIRLYRGDTVTFASASNTVPAATPPTPGEGTTLNGAKVGRPDLAVSVDDLIDLIAAPELDLFP